MKQVAKRGFFHRKGRVGMKKRRSKTGSVLLFLLIFLLAAFMAFPLYYTVIQSLKPIEEIFRFPPTLYVSRPVMDNYGEMFRILANMWVPLSRYLFNTLFIAVLGTGAYNYSMASNYNRNPRAEIVMVKDGVPRTVVKRETYADIIRNDI